MSETPKSVDDLMRYLRTIKHIKISGSAQKRKLRNIGYYHGYKGYRYINSPYNQIPFTDFNQLQAIINFDMHLKALLYPKLMFIETALKNYVLEIVLEEAKASSFEEIYPQLLVDYRSYPTASKEYHNRFRKRLELRNKIYNGLTRDYCNNKQVVQHFYHKNKSIPIWAIFEVISLGEFGSFVSCLRETTRKSISKSIGFHQGCDTNGRLPQITIYTIKDLRNAVAHNEVIFDTRFRTGQISHSLLTCIKESTDAGSVDLNHISDYILLITYLLKLFDTPKTELIRFIKDFEHFCETLRKQIPISIYSKIIPTDIAGKIRTIYTFIQK